jgi:hypothetical protein
MSLSGRNDRWIVCCAEGSGVRTLTDPRGVIGKTQFN